MQSLHPKFKWQGKGREGYKGNLEMKLETMDRQQKQIYFPNPYVLTHGTFTWGLESLGI